MRLLIIRHADPDYPNNTITAAGHLEAAALAKRMATLRPSLPSRLYASPLGRARHTADYTAKALGMAYAIEDWTAELGCGVNWPADGPKIAAWDVPAELLREPATDELGAGRWSTDMIDHPDVRAEREKVARGSDEFLARHGYVREGGRFRIVQGHRDTIAVFCHGGFGLTWLAHLLALPLAMVWGGFWLPPSSVTTVLFDERSADWATPRAIGVGDVSHLYEAGLAVQPSGIKANYQ